MLRKDDLIDIEEVFSGMPNEAYWKLLIDYKYWHQEDPFLFDKQFSPHYLKNISKALLYLFETINQEPTLELIIELHDIASHDKNARFMGIKDTGVSELIFDSVSLEGLEELLEKNKKMNYIFSIYYNIFKRNGEVITSVLELENTTLTTSQLAYEIFENLRLNNWTSIGLQRETSIQAAKEEINTMLDQYKKSILESGSDTEILHAIVTLIKELHQYHPFQDGNGRTFIFLLLNKLLIMNDLSPSTVEKNYQFSGLSVQELVSEVEIGQQQFKDICTLEVNKNQSLQEYIKQQINIEKETGYKPGSSSVAFFSQQSILGKESEDLYEHYSTSIRSLEKDFNQFIEDTKKMNKADMVNLQPFLLLFTEIKYVLWDFRDAKSEDETKYQLNIDAFKTGYLELLHERKDCFLDATLYRNLKKLINDFAPNSLEKSKNNLKPM